MSRVKRGVIHHKKRVSLYKKVKGYKWGRKNKIRLARPAMLKAGRYAYRDRRTKKRLARSLWLVRINAACRLNGTTYSKLISGLKNAKIELDRKILADLALNNPTVFSKIVAAIKK